MNIRRTVLLVVLALVGCSCGAKDIDRQKTRKDFRTRAYKMQREYSDEDTIAEIRFGRVLAARVLGMYKLFADEKSNRYLRNVGTGLAAQMGRADLRFHFAILDTAEINAYALPGGYIFVTRGALALMENEAQLTAVLAHEIAHINQRHIVKKLNIKGEDNRFLASISAVTGGSLVHGAQLVDKLVTQAIDALFDSGLDKQLETSADAEAIQIQIVLGYDWHAYIEFLKKCSHKKYAKNRIINSKTHPPPQNRIEIIRLAVQREGMTSLSGKKHKNRFNENIRL